MNTVTRAPLVDLTGLTAEQAAHVQATVVGALSG